MSDEDDFLDDWKAIRPPPLPRPPEPPVSREPLPAWEPASSLRGRSPSQTGYSAQFSLPAGVANLQVRGEPLARNRAQARILRSLGTRLPAEIERVSREIGEPEGTPEWDARFFERVSQAVSHARNATEQRRRAK